MEVDIEIHLNNVARGEISSLAKQFLVESANKDAGGELQDIVIRQEANNRTGIVDHIVRDFLNNMTSFSEIIRKHQGVLRLGIFYDIEESVVFPFRLSCEAIKLIADLNILIDATGYPCSPDN